jgi:deoxyadenosine/deoxycytidine kinase
MIVCFEGIIGATKSTQARIAAENFGFKLFEEPADTNPDFIKYLDLFYTNMKRYALEFQYFTLGCRDGIEEGAIDHTAATGQGSIIDRSRRGDDVFAWCHYRAGNISELGYRAYSALNKRKRNAVERWMTFVFLQASVEICYERIKERARKAEKKCDPDIWIPYLRQLDDRYFYEMDRASREDGRLVIKVDANSDDPQKIHQNIKDALFEYDKRWNLFWTGWSRELETRGNA